MMRASFILVATVVLMVGSGVSQTLAVSEPAVREAEKRMMTAAFAGNPEAFAAMCDPDYRTVNEDGSAGNLHDVMIEMKVNPLKMGARQPEYSESLFRVVGDSAFISGRVKIENAKGIPLDLRYLEVWTIRSGAWKLVHWQATRVTPEGEAREKIVRDAK